VAVQPCVRCHNPIAVGSQTCSFCGAEHPHRSRPVRAAAVARRRMVVVGCVVLAVLAYVALSFVWVGGEERTSQCRAYDAAQARYERAAGSGEDVGPDVIAQLDRLRAACADSEH
jgi:hypothetical protein